MYYDIYLRDVCRAQLDLDDLLAVIPALETPTVQTKLTPVPPPPPGVLQRHPPTPGFLELDLEEALAREVSRRLAAVHGVGEILPVAYRTPQISKEQAQQIAEQELRRICQQKYPGYHFEPVRLWKEEVRTWVFSTISKQMRQERGLVFGSGGPLVSVDKVDGHIWQDEEMLARGKEIFTY